MGIRVLHFGRRPPQQRCLRSTIGRCRGGRGAGAQAKSQSCTLQGGPTRSVIRVIDAETVLLDDNQEVRLVGALAPRSPDLSPSAQPWRPKRKPLPRCARWCSDDRCRSPRQAARRDRYGRKLAHLFIDRDGERVWVQGELLTGGHARVYGLPGSYACMRELLAHERVARNAATGLWANAAYAVRRVETYARTHAPAQFVRDRRRHRRQGSGDESADLHQLRCRLAKRLHGGHRSTRAARQS